MQDKKFIVTLYDVNDGPKFNMTEQPQECLDIWLNNQKNIISTTALGTRAWKDQDNEGGFGPVGSIAAIYNL